MINRKIIIYREQTDKPMVLTDSDMDASKVQDEVTEFKNILKDSKDGDIVVIEFSNDFLIFRPKKVDLVIIGKPEIKNIDLLTDEDDEINKLKNIDKTNPIKEESIDIVDDDSSVQDVKNKISISKKSGSENLKSIDSAYDTLKKLSESDTDQTNSEDDEIEVFIDNKENDSKDEKTEDSYTGIK